MQEAPEHCDARVWQGAAAAIRSRQRHARRDGTVSSSSLLVFEAEGKLFLAEGWGVAAGAGKNLPLAVPRLS